ncbi:class I SAM-dependent methyltransferase [Marisediminicola sp. LYQ134]|uniref:class I SAM-dependent methyltransferase n=1 Tax=unclassified Marisediminicola TaxID=2618316 RepID=UPI00398360ED
MPIGSVTRGTTGTNRLRRVDRWIEASAVVRAIERPLVVDLGFGASATTTLELHRRLARSHPLVRVVGVEIDPARVEVAKRSERPGVTFRVGGFEVALPGGERPDVIRAFNVLRQYDEADVLPQWRRMSARLAPAGIVVEGTCDEIGRVSSWVAIGAEGPRTLTVSLRVSGLETPSIVAERLPKALIHRNVAGERIHALLEDLDRAWSVAANLSPWGPTQRWIATVDALESAGWPVRDARSRSRLGEVTVDWHAVAPAGFRWAP